MPGCGSEHRDHQTPGDGGQLETDVQERERRLGRDDHSHGDGGVDDHRCDPVGEDVSGDDAPVAGTERAGGVDVVQPSPTALTIA